MGEDALGDGSQGPTLDLGLLLEQRGRRRLIDPLAFREVATGLLHAGVMLHRELQLRGEPSSWWAAASSRVVMISRAKALLVARSWGFHGWGSVRAKSSAPMGSWRWRTGTHDHLVTTDEMGRVRITFTVDAAGLGVNTIGPLFAGIYARKPGGISIWAY